MLTHNPHHVLSSQNKSRFILDAINMAIIKVTGMEQNICVKTYLISRYYGLFVESDVTE